MTTTCVSRALVVDGAIDDVVLRPCHRPATTILTLGCVHEHVLRVPSCPVHFAATRNGLGYCGACLTGPQPHTHCRMDYLRHDPLQETP